MNVGQKRLLCFHRCGALSITNSCLLSGGRLLIPTTLRYRVLKQLHSGHSGVQRIASLARSYEYWPLMGKDVEIIIKECHCKYNHLVAECRKAMVQCSC